MGLLDFFRSPNRNSAALAKQRLQIIVAHERGRSSEPDYLPLLQRDLLQAVRKYVPIDDDQVMITIDRDGECDVLELNITLPDPGEPAAGDTTITGEAAAAGGASAPADMPGLRRRKPRRR